MLDRNRTQADIWSPRPLILAGGYTPELALSDAEKYKNSLVAFGRYYIANVSPRRPFRWLARFPLHHSFPSILPARCTPLRID